MREGYVPVPGGRLYYQESGAGPAVILMHAGIADHTMWDAQVGPFSGHYRIVRYDLRGFGRSSMPEADFMPHDDLRLLLEHLEIEKPALVGVSVSGGIAVDFAIAHPGGLWALVPVAAGLDGYDWSGDESLARFGAEEKAAIEAGDLDRAVELNVELWVDGPGRGPGDVDPAVRERVRQMQRAIFEKGDPAGEALSLEPLAIERLDEIRAPTLAVVGDQDVPAIIEITDIIAARVPGARKAIIANAAHVPNMERPEEFNRLVLDFLDAHAPASY